MPLLTFITAVLLILCVSSSLRESDRDLLKKAASRASTHAVVGSVIGIALGAALGFRMRANRKAFYQAIRVTEKPTHVRFADGREEAIPDITPLLKPTPLGDVATLTFCAIAGLFLGGETGLLTGTSSAKRMITNDPATQQRITTAFRSYQADVLRKQIQQLEGKKDGDDTGEGLLW
jgi:hypothetical protein